MKNCNNSPKNLNANEMNETILIYRANQVASKQLIFPDSGEG
jgi:hypothetical protein